MITQIEAFSKNIFNAKNRKEMGREALVTEPLGQ
jgi:hypothetical protein